MSRFGLSTRIGAAIAFTLTMLGLLAAVSYYSTVSIGGIFTGYQSTANQSMLLNQKMVDLFEGRIAAYKYRLTGSEAQADNLRASVQEIVAAKDKASKLLEGDQEGVAIVGKLTQEAKQFAAAFDEMTALDAQHDALVDNIVASGRNARETLTEIMTVAHAKGDIEASYATGLAVKELLMARYYSKSYLFDNKVAHFDRAKAHLETATARLAELRSSALHAEERSLAAKAQSETTAFSEAFYAIRSIIDARNMMSEAKLDVLGPKMQKDFEVLLDRVVEHQHELGLVGETTVDSTLFLVLALSTGAVLIGASGGFFLARKVSRDVAKMADNMKTLANGDLDITVAGAEHNHELGRMAQALQVFKKNAERVGKLQEERERQEAEAAEQRADMMATLQRSFGDVVDAAVQGDFSKRVEAEFADAELNELAQGVNRLLETVASGLDETGRVLSQVADGDLSDQMRGEFDGAFGELQSNVNNTVERLSKLVEQISTSVAGVRRGAGEIADGSQDLSGRAEQQASSLEETAATMEEMSASIKSNADSASSAQSLASDASGRADQGGRIVKDAVGAMGAIEESASKIADIISVIDGIAFQTNLLALNAAVEAARAGDAGKGFAVVASEVRALAQRSADAARDIRALIEKSASQVSDGVRLVTETGGALDGIVASIAQVEESVNSIALSSKEQAAGVEEISSTISHMDQMTQQNSSLAEQSASNARALLEGAETLRGLIAFFEKNGGGAERAHDAAWSAEAKAQQAPATADHAPAARATANGGWSEF